MDKDILIRLDRLKKTTPNINLEFRDLYNWMLSLQEAEERDKLSGALVAFVQDQLGAKVDGQEYADWLASQPDKSPQIVAWYLYAMALWKAYQYRQSQEDQQK